MGSLYKQKAATANRAASGGPRSIRTAAESAPALAEAVGPGHEREPDGHAALALLEDAPGVALVVRLISAGPRSATWWRPT